MRTRAVSRVFVLAVVLALAASGCLRRKYDLCLENPPHMDCPFDAGPDAAPIADAGTPDSGDAP